MKHKKDCPIFVIIIEIFLVKMDYMGGNVLGPSWILTGVFFLTCFKVSNGRILLCYLKPLKTA